MLIKELEELVRKGNDGLIDYSGDPSKEGFHQGKVMAVMHNLSSHIAAFLVAYERLQTETAPMDIAINQTIVKMNWANLKNAINQEK